MTSAITFLEHFLLNECSFLKYKGICSWCIYDTSTCLHTFHTVLPYFLTWECSVLSFTHTHTCINTHASTRTHAHAQTGTHTHIHAHTVASVRQSCLCWCKDNLFCAGNRKEGKNVFHSKVPPPLTLSPYNPPPQPIPQHPWHLDIPNVAKETNLSPNACAC